MKMYGTLFLAGMLALFMGERVFYGDETKRMIFDLLGATALLSGLILILKDKKAAADHQRSAYNQPLAYALLSICALLIYFLGTETVVDALGFEGESAHNFGVIISCLWPIVMLCGMLPLLALSRMIQNSSRHFSDNRAKDRAILWLTAAFALSALVPLNYFAHDTNERWDLGYFKTAMPGTATTQLIDSLNEPVVAYLFFPSNSDVRQEIRTYFDQIDSPMLETTYIDLLEESVSEEIKDVITKGRINQNGSVLLVTGQKDLAINKPVQSQEEIKSGDHSLIKGLVAGKCDEEATIQIVDSKDLKSVPLTAIKSKTGIAFEIAVPKSGSTYMRAICDNDNNDRIKDGIDLISEPENVAEQINGESPSSAKEPIQLVLERIEPKTQTVKIGNEFKDAKKNLLKMDGKILEKITKLTQEKKNVYITSGHEEMHWKSRDGLPKSQQIAQFKRMLRTLNYKAEELNIGNGLASEVPEDADAVLILGPREAFMEAEVEALNQYRKRGGSLFIALEPGGTPLDGLLNPLQLQFEAKTFLVNEDPAFAITRNRRDIATNKYSSHPSITQLSRYGKAAVGFFGMGAIDKLDGSKAKSVVRSPEKVWKDFNGNLKHDADSEKKKLHDIAVAVSEKHQIENDSGEMEEVESRVIVVGDSTWLSDPWLPQVKTNQVAAWDFLKWLIKDPAAGGVSNEEKDVKIIHSKAGQSWIFYGTVLLFPLLIFVFGWTYVGRRRKRGNVQ